MTPRNLVARLVAGAFAAVLLPSIAASPAQAAAPAPRPTEDLYDGAEAAPVCRDDVCVHYAQDGTNDVPTEDDGPAGAWHGYADNGVPDYVDLISASLVPRTAKVLTDAGYRAPLSDGTAGGGGQVDIYLADLDGVAGGAYCTKERVADTYTAAGFCVLDNDYATAEYGTRLSRGAYLRLDVAHQYTTLVTWAYHVTGGSNIQEDALWLDEATATWVEEEMYPTLNRNRAYLPYGPLGRPASELGGYDLATVSGRGQTPYEAAGGWIFLQYLAQRFPAEQGTLPVVIREWWERLATFESKQPMFSDDEDVNALEPVLQQRGTSVMAELTRFNAIWNRAPASHYADGASYRAAPSLSTTTLSRTRRVVEQKDDTGGQSSYTFRFRPDSTLTGSWKLKLNLFASNDHGHTERSYVATFKAKGRAPVTRVVAKDYIADKLVFRFSSSVEWVDITLVTGLQRDPDDILESVSSDYRITAAASRG